MVRYPLSLGQKPLPGPLKNPVISFGLLGFLLYWPVWWFTPYDGLRLVLAALLFVEAVFITVFYAPGLWEAIRPLRPGEEPRDLRAGRWHLIIGVLLAFGTLAAQQSWGVAVREMGRPQWMLDSPINGFFAYSFCVAAALILVAPGNVRPDDPNIPAQSWRWIAIALGVAGVMAGIAIGFFLK